ncbi:MAG TPA: divalent-cation tolerance protein CutA [Candidatus Binataceae bacterium]
MRVNRRGSERIVMVTAASEEQAETIGRALVAEQLAACVNIVGPIRSIYRWAGKIEDEREYLMIIKSRAALFPDLESRVRELHTYEVPEVLSLALDSGSAPYLDWIRQSTQPVRARRSPTKAVRPAGRKR